MGTRKVQHFAITVFCVWNTCFHIYYCFYKDAKYKEAIIAYNFYAFLQSTGYNTFASTEWLLNVIVMYYRNDVFLCISEILPHYFLIPICMTCMHAVNSDNIVQITGYLTLHIKSRQRQALTPSKRYGIYIHIYIK